MSLMLLAPIALLGLFALAAPIAIHILAKRRAPRVPFPTLRFIQPGRLASVRRHVLEDAALLAVRLSILAAAAVALAGPLVVTRQRDAMWNARTQMVAVSGADLSHGLRRAVAALEDAPPGRREITIRAPFPIGSITQADVATVPVAIGLRFERAGALPPTRPVDLPAVLSESGVRIRTMTVDRATTMREAAAVTGFASLEAFDANTAAVLSQRVLAPVNGRRVRVVAAGSSEIERIISSATAVREAWMADALAFVSRDRDLRDGSSQVTAHLTDARLMKSPWIVVARAADGRPLASGAAIAGTLTLVSAAPTDALASPLLVRAAMNAIGDHRVPTDAETLPIPDAQLRAWTRAPGAARPPRPDTLEHDDRRWFWLLALALLGVESAIRRRSNREALTEREALAERHTGDARVA